MGCQRRHGYPGCLIPLPGVGKQAAAVTYRPSSIVITIRARALARSASRPGSDQEPDQQRNQQGGCERIQAHGQPGEGAGDLADLQRPRGADTV